MKNRRIFLGIATLLLGLGIVSVSLSGSLKETLSKRTTSPATTVASSSDKSSEVMPARAETAQKNFLANPLNLERLTNNADLIIIGRVSSISNAGRATATLGIDKVVKGEADARTVDFEFFPNRPSAYVRIQPELFGMFFLKWNEAVGGYRILDPTYPAAWNNLAIAHEHEGRFEEARKAYEKALSLDPDNLLIRQNFDLFKEINDRAKCRTDR